MAEIVMVMMKKTILINTILFLSSCTGLPAMAESIEKIATDDAICLKIDRDAIKKDTDVYVQIDICNKDSNH
jgi:hypothetical protein